MARVHGSVPRGTDRPCDRPGEVVLFERPNGCDSSLDGTSVRAGWGIRGMHSALCAVRGWKRRYQTTAHRQSRVGGCVAVCNQPRKRSGVPHLHGAPDTTAASTSFGRALNSVVAFVVLGAVTQQLDS